MNKLELMRIMLINSSVGASAVRNQGSAGIAKSIRDTLIKKFDLDSFLRHLKAKDEQVFKNYLRNLTNKIIRQNNNIRWGTARKCINLVLRSVVYNRFISHHYGLKQRDYKSGGLVDKLELPLDSYSIKGIKKDCRKYKLGFDYKSFSKFSIIRLNRKNKLESNYYQKRAELIAGKRKICRVDLDLCYWRNQNDCD
jgi:hypothetical protein